MYRDVHNILNATAAIAVGVGLDVAVEAIRAGLDQFRGVDRRFQLRGRAAGVSVIDDYGHHPTEIKATLAAARQCGFRKVHVVFQPHRYTRTRDLMEDFSHGVCRRGFAVCARYLCGEREADRGNQRGSVGADGAREGWAERAVCEFVLRMQ